MTLSEFRDMTKNYSDDIEIKTMCDEDYLNLRILNIEHFEDDGYKPMIILCE